MKYVNTCIWGIILITLTGSACQQKKAPALDTDPISDSIGAFMTEFSKADSFNGTALVAGYGKVIYQGSFGIRDPRTGKPLTEDVPFYLASVAKHMTCMTLLMLSEKGKLTLDDPLSDYFPELGYADSITIKQMMTHTSGIPDYYDLGKFKPGMTNQDVLKALLEGPGLDFPPGDAYNYSNSAYVLLSMIASKAAGKSYSEFVNENIFMPLGMDHSYIYDETKPIMPDRAIGFTQQGKIDDYHAYTTGGGGIFSSVTDMFIWEKALHSDKLVSRALIEQAYQPTPLNEGSLSYYGFGWMLNKGNPRQVRHTGSLAGFRTFFFRDLETQHMIILLSNNTNLKLAKAAEGIWDILSNDSSPTP